VLLVVGDSLSAEYGLRRGSGWVQLLSERLARSASQYSVVNASISGDTTSGGRSRLPALLARHHPALVIIELGGNDGLRGLPVKSMRENLSAMVRESQEAHAKVLLVGMRLPPNFGEPYTEAFFGAYGEVARERRVALVPFLLDGFALDDVAFQADRIHPREAQQPRMMENVWKGLAPLL